MVFNPIVAQWMRAALVAGLATAGACDHTPRRSGPLSITDDTGYEVTLPAPARRVVSLVPATTELVFAIGAEDKLVGRTAWADYPPEVTRVPNLGDGINPNLEAILGATPDLVLLYLSGQNQAPADRLRAAGVAVALFRTDRLSDVESVAIRLGRLTGRDAAADSLVAAYRSALAEAGVATPPAEPTTVFMLVWDQPPITIGAGSFLTELVERAGARNLFDDITAPSAPVSIETVAARDPDLILTLGTETPAFLSRPEWQAVAAVRNRRIVSVAGSEFNRPSPRASDAIRVLRQALEDTAR